MVKPQVQWMAGSPLWPALAPSRAAMLQPALLRFASDTFMEDLGRLLESDPRNLTGYVAQKESFRVRPPGAPSWDPRPPVLKLYQPVHGHFCLIAASLVCRLPGLPDHTVNAAAEEKAGFVLRRLGTQGEEMAWVDDSQGKRWLVLSEGQKKSLPPKEEVLPLFPMNYTQDGLRRRLFVGLIPTSSRESFQAAPSLTPITVETDASGNAIDPRIEEIEQRVLERWEELRDPNSPLLTPQQIEVSQFLLLDLADFLSLRLPALWTLVQNQTPPPAGSAGAGLYSLLTTQTVDGSTTWRSALLAALAQWDRIAGESGSPPTLNFNLRTSPVTPASLRSALLAALAGSPAPPPAAGAQPAVPKLDPSGGVTYRLRCVYRKPRCGPLAKDEVSEPSEEFVLAPFFDPDAPGRPIRITMPVDTSPAGLRKFPKNVAILVSDKLRQQMAAVGDPKAALAGDVAQGPPFDLGEICSFSIPIITICALIVLMIFIQLLNIIFWWLPFLKICLPLKLKAK